MLTVTKDQVATFLVNHHRLRPSALPSLTTVQDVFHHLRLIQYDPLNPCGRNVDLVLQARLAKYHPNAHASWAYGQSGIVEGYDKELCLLPIDDWGYLQYGTDRMSSKRRQFLEEHKKELDDMVRYMAEHGPIFTDTLKDGRMVDIGWYGKTSWSKTALESLWRLGRVVSARQNNGRKMYDLPERVYGHAIPSRPPLATHVARRLSSVGLLPLSGGGTGWQGMVAGRIVGPQLKVMTQEGTLTEVAIEGVKARYVVRSQDIPLLESPLQTKQSIVFLAPLDNLMWDRQMIYDVFGFFYRWEVYTPQYRRVHGYYCLPILDGHQMIGRIEPLYQNGELIVKGVWWEPGIRPNKVRFEQGLRRFQRYLGAETIVRP